MKINEYNFKQLVTIYVFLMNLHQILNYYSVLQQFQLADKKWTQN